MRLGNRNHERFWISFVVCFAFGFMFLIASINIFCADWDPNPNVTFTDNISKNVTAFAETLAKGYEASWVNFKVQGATDAVSGAPVDQTPLGLNIIKRFLKTMPYVLLVLSILLLTGFFFQGILLRPALRLSAIFLVLLGLGKYLTDFRSGNTLTTLQDFMYAMFICLALFVLSREPDPPVVIEDAR